MEQVSSRLFTPEAPISRLHHDIIWEIFSLNPWVGNSPIEKTLDYIRYSSQVCRSWRKILLNSSSIWGKCINFDLLDQNSDSWRNLMLERTGKSQLSITGGKRGILHPRRVMWSFLANLLEEHWTRIRYLDLHIAFTKSSEIAFFGKALRHPAEKLKKLLIKGSGPWKTPHDFQLFSAHTPSLVKLSLPFALWPQNFHAPSVFTSSMRYLWLTQYLKFKYIDLLAACMQMPFLEVLVLKLSNVITSPPSEAIIHPESLPSLKLIEVDSPNLDIYPAFLGCISPSVGCALRVCHVLDTWSTLPMEAKIKDLKCMCSVVECYATSFFAHHDHVSDVGDIQTIGLDISRNYFGFTCCDPKRDHIEIYVRLEQETNTEMPLFVAMLLDSVSTFKLPTTFTGLRLSSDSPLDGGFLQHVESSLLRALHSIGSIVQLETGHHVLSYLGNTAESNGLFPRLEDVSMKILSENFETIKASIMPFLRRRLNAAPLKNLDITNYTRSSPPKDMHCLDEITGLNVVWKALGRHCTFL